MAIPGQRLLQQIGQMLSGLDLVPSSSPFIDTPAPSRTPRRQMFDPNPVPRDRYQKMMFLDRLEEEVTEARRGVEAYATMATTGNLAGTSDSSFVIDLIKNKDDYPKDLLARLERTQEIIQNISWAYVREMCKFGSVVPFIELDTLGDGKMGVRDLRMIPPATMFRNTDGFGKSDPRYWWIQVIDGNIASDGPKKGHSFSKGTFYAGTGHPRALCPHFALWSSIVSATEVKMYGTSILECFARIALLMWATLDGAAVARLTRAVARYKFEVDVGDLLSNTENLYGRVRSRIRRYQQEMERHPALYSEGVDSFRRAMMPDENFYVPRADKYHNNVELMNGDSNVPRVNDIEMLARWYFGALGVPPEYLGHERSQGGRSVLSQIDVQFARNARGIQSFASPAFSHIVWVDMLAGGWDPRKYPIRVKPPKIGARDELLQAQVKALQATVVATLAAAGMRIDVAPKWVLQTFLDLDRELDALDKAEIDKLFVNINGQAAGEEPAPSDAKSVREAIGAMNGQLTKQIRSNLRFIASLERLTDHPMAGHDHPGLNDLAAQMEHINGEDE